MADLEAYLKLIDQERECRPSEAVLADEIFRLRAYIDTLPYPSDHDEVLAENARLVRCLSHQVGGNCFCEECDAVYALPSVVAAVDGYDHSDPAAHTGAWMRGNAHGAAS